MEKLSIYYPQIIFIYSVLNYYLNYSIISNAMVYFISIKLISF